MSSEIFEKFRKFAAKCFRKPSSTFEFFLEFSEIVGSFRESSEVFVKNRKMSKSSQNDLWTLFENFRKFSEISGSVRKCSKNFGNPWKIFERTRRFMRNCYAIPTSDTCGLKIRFKNFDLYFALVLRFMHWCYSLTALL